MSFEIDFREIRPYEGDKRKGFEELVCQLARREKIDNAIFHRVEGAGGDGGVEAYWLLKDGTEYGYQAKYFLATKDIDWSQIDKSVKVALEQHPTLRPLIPKIFANWKENYAIVSSKPAKLGMIKSALVFSPVVMTAFPSLVR